MMRALWTGASGMVSQQTNVDTIAHNLSNINTTGFKSERVEFKSLLYQTIQGKSYDNEGERKPVGIQVGLGSRYAAISSQYTQGNFTETGNMWDFAINGDGFFGIQMPDGTTSYTRNGSFKMSIGVNGSTLCNAEGNPVLDINGAPISVDAEIVPSKIVVDQYGKFYYPDETGKGVAMGIQIGTVEFSNPTGLTKGSNSMLKESLASGAPRWDATGTKNELRQKYTEASNVQAVDEMVNLIVAQRAYEMSSKVITASDTMLQQANNLRG